MSRLVVHTATGPKKIKGKNEDKNEDMYMCMCGLSKKKPFCDGSHQGIKKEAEDELNVYDEDGSSLSVEEGGSCCGEKCCDEGDKDSKGKKHKKDGCCGGRCC